MPHVPPHSSSSSDELPITTIAAAPEYRSEPRSSTPIADAWKRGFDITASLGLLLILAPVMVGIALFVRCFLGSPVLFRQRRVGRDGELFEMVKFRSMRDATDAAGRPLPDSERLTPFGKLLRKSSLDELPELINVLRGEMSLVGPRPLLPQYVPLWTPEQFRRHDVRPGVTGWAQVNGRNAISWDEKFRLDCWYVDHRSLWLDIKTLCLTVVKVLVPSGISQDGQATAAAFDASLSRRVVVFGAGGHAKVVIATLRRLGLFVEAIYDDNTERHGSTVAGVPIVGSVDQYAAGEIRRGIIAIGSAEARKQIADRVSCHWLTAVDPMACVAASATLEPGCYIAAGAVVQPDAYIGEHTIINTGASVDHDCSLGHYVHVAPGAHLAGDVTLEDEVFIGAAAACIPGVTIGQRSTVGAGGVVVSDLPAGVTAVGVPAKPQQKAFAVRRAA